MHMDMQRLIPGCLGLFLPCPLTTNSTQQGRDRQSIHTPPSKCGREHTARGP